MVIAFKGNYWLNENNPQKSHEWGMKGDILTDAGNGLNTYNLALYTFVEGRTAEHNGKSDGLQAKKVNQEAPAYSCANTYTYT